MNAEELFELVMARIEQLEFGIELLELRREIDAAIFEVELFRMGVSRD